MAYLRKLDQCANKEANVDNLFEWFLCNIPEVAKTLNRSLISESYRTAWRKIQSSKHLTFGIIKNNNNLPWAMAVISNNTNIPLSIIKNNMDYYWDWSIISTRDDIPWDIIQTDLTSSYPCPWDWGTICANPNITWKIIQNNPQYPWKI